ncbi:MAG: hypothetical protein KBT28_12410 [Bacteroidales bacterium]|nr:hypothetical protein [Candidatus Colimorpha merdihippi]
MSGSVCVTIQSEHSVQVKLKPLEWNDLVKKELFGDGNVDASGNVKINAVEIEEKPFVFDMRGRGGKLIRVCVPRMRLNTHDAIVFKSSGALAAGITYDCLPDSNGNNAYIYEAEAQ